MQNFDPQQTLVLEMKRKAIISVERKNTDGLSQLSQHLRAAIQQLPDHYETQLRDDLPAQVCSREEILD